MVKVSIEVVDGSARFEVAVCAQSIERALSLVAARYPRGQGRVTFPIEPEGFFIKDHGAQAVVEAEGGDQRPERRRWAGCADTRPATQSPAA